MDQELIFIRDNGDTHQELTTSTDKQGIAYIRADLVGSAVITQRLNLYLEGDDCKTDLKSPCNGCYHADGDEDIYPCVACMWCG